MSSQRIRRLAGTSLLVAAVVGVGVAALVALRSNSPSGSAPRIALIGDSIVAENQSAMADHFDARELGVLIDAQSGRNLVNSFDYEGRTIRSGVTAVAELRATGFEPDLWVIELGTNDLAFMRDCDCDPGRFNPP